MNVVKSTQLLLSLAIALIYIPEYELNCLCIVSGINLIYYIKANEFNPKSNSI